MWAKRLCRLSGMQTLLRPCGNVLMMVMCAQHKNRLQITRKSWESAQGNKGGPQLAPAAAALTWRF